jgi:hypothetical protein
MDMQITVQSLNLGDVQRVTPHSIDVTLPTTEFSSGAAKRVSANHS